jgi:FkbM family methyltransferase
MRLGFSGTFALTFARMCAPADNQYGVRMQSPRKSESILHRIEHRIALKVLKRHALRIRDAGYPQLAILSQDYIGQHVQVFGRYEDELLLALESLLAEQVLSDSCALDVGANIGNHSVAFSEWFAAVYAFEPHPRTFELLRFNTAPFENIICRAVALSSDTKQVVLRSQPGNSGAAQLVSHQEVLEPQFVSVVPAVTLDAIADEFGERVGLIKIDVEGHEEAVLLGGARLLETHRPIVLFEQRRIEANVFALLERFGYQSFAYFSPKRWVPRWPRFWRRLAGSGILFGREVYLKEVNSWREIPDYGHGLVAALPSRGR